MARPGAEVVQVEVHGLDELVRDLPDFAHRTEQACAGALVQVAELTSQVTALRVPVLTGKFRASIKAERIAADRPTARVSSGSGIEYGRWLEFGRRKRSGAKRGGRYLLPTARREKRNVKKRLVDTTNQEIDRYPWPR